MSDESILPSDPLKLTQEIYQELRRLAAGRMARESSCVTLQPTALVHEAWLRLGGEKQPDWENRAHFFGAAAEAMRRILIDRARRRSALRRGGGIPRVEFNEAFLAPDADADPDLLVRLDEALARLATRQPRKAELVKLRYFGGLTLEEAARVLGISEPTAKRWWSYARACLHAELQSARSPGAP
ncbi:MAG: sigma-70 family RNA polymerase sigma factor [Opitutae bacterium]|nr:sigma-70 family RNA polymerase sigma factor [Opitutae bacterium]